MSDVLYFIHCGGMALTCTQVELPTVLKRAGYSFICSQVKDDGQIRPMTAEEKACLPLDEPFDVLVEPDSEGDVVVRHDDNPLAHPMDCIKWPTGRYGQYTEKGFPFKVQLADLFPQLLQRKP